jgi:hypothetical protein
LADFESLGIVDALHRAASDPQLKRLDTLGRSPIAMRELLSGL